MGKSKMTGALKQPRTSYRQPQRGRDREETRNRHSQSPNRSESRSKSEYRERDRIDNIEREIPQPARTPLVDRISRVDPPQPESAREVQQSTAHTGKRKFNGDDGVFLYKKTVLTKNNRPVVEKEVPKRHTNTSPVTTTPKAIVGQATLALSREDRAANRAARFAESTPARSPPTAHTSTPASGAKTATTVAAYAPSQPAKRTPHSAPRDARSSHEQNSSAQKNAGTIHAATSSNAQRPTSPRSPPSSSSTESKLGERPAPRVNKTVLAQRIEQLKAAKARKKAKRRFRIPSLCDLQRGEQLEPFPQCVLNYIQDEEGMGIPILYSSYSQHVEDEMKGDWVREDIRAAILRCLTQGHKWSDLGFDSKPKYEGPEHIFHNISLYFFQEKIHISTPRGLLLFAEYTKLLGLPASTRLRFEGRKPSWVKLALDEQARAEEAERAQRQEARLASGMIDWTTHEYKECRLYQEALERSRRFSTPAARIVSRARFGTDISDDAPAVAATVPKELAQTTSERVEEAQGAARIRVRKILPGFEGYKPGEESSDEDELAPEKMQRVVEAKRKEERVRKTLPGFGGEKEEDQVDWDDDEL